MEFPDSELYLLGGGKARDVYGGALCVDCLGTWRNTSSAWARDDDRFHGWQLNSYDYVEVYDVNATERVHNVIGLDGYRLPMHAVIGRWVDSDWSCAATSGLCSRRYRMSEYDSVTDSWSTTKGVPQRTFILDTISAN